MISLLKISTVTKQQAQGEFSLFVLYCAFLHSVFGFRLYVTIVSSHIHTMGAVIKFILIIKNVIIFFQSNFKVQFHENSHLKKYHLSPSMC